MTHLDPEVTIIYSHPSISFCFVQEHPPNPNPPRSSTQWRGISCQALAFGPYLLPNTIAKLTIYKRLSCSWLIRRTWIWKTSIFHIINIFGHIVPPFSTKCDNLSFLPSPFALDWRNFIGAWDCYLRIPIF